jgi:hypothetical protein
MELTKWQIRYANKVRTQREDVEKRWHDATGWWQLLSCGHTRRVDRKKFYWETEANCQVCRGQRCISK